MTVIAINDRGNFDILYFPKNFNVDIYDEYAYGSEVVETLEKNIVRYGVKIGKEYTVHGILSYKNQNRFLIIDEMNEWSFIPCEIFVVYDNNINKNWFYNHYVTNSGLLSIISYSYITNDYNSFVKLIEGDSDIIYSLYKYIIIPTESEKID